MKGLLSFCLFCAILLASSASASSLLKPMWSLPAGVNSSSAIVVGDPSSGVLVVAAEKEESSSSSWSIKGINATDKRILYTLTPPSGGFVPAAVELNTKHQLVGITWNSATNPQQIPGQFAMYHLSNGKPALTIHLQVDEAVTLGTDSIVITTSFPELQQQVGLPPMKLLKYSLPSGHLDFNRTTARLATSIEVAVADHVIAILAGPPQGGTVGVWMFDKSNGDYICKFPAWMGPINSGIPIAGDIISIGGGVFGNTTTCKNLDISVPAGGEITLHGRHLYNWNSATKELMQFNDQGTKVWTSTLKDMPSDLAGKFFAVTSTAFNPDAIIINNRGVFAAINKTSGALMWNTSSVVVPFAPENSQGQQVYPLGDHNLLIRNLQGYILLDTRNGGVVRAREEMMPMTAAFSFMKKKEEQPYVVFGDLLTGDLMAVELKS